MGIELKPCPFCGGEAELVHVRGAIFVECENENCPVCPHTPVIEYETEEQAANAWNTRADTRTCATCYYFQTVYDRNRPTERRACFGEHLRVAVGGLDWDEEAEAWAEMDPTDVCSKWTPRD